MGQLARAGASGSAGGVFTLRLAPGSAREVAGWCHAAHLQAAPAVAAPAHGHAAQSPRSVGADRSLGCFGEVLTVAMTVDHLVGGAAIGL